MTQPKSPKPLQVVTEKLARHDLVGFRKVERAGGKTVEGRSVAKVGNVKFGAIKPPSS